MNTKNTCNTANSEQIPSRPTNKIASFIALRGNGWSLSRIARELCISKSTAWDWDNKNRGEVHLLKHFQLEKLQDQYMPSYEEELKALNGYLAKIEQALQKHDFEFTSPECLMQMALQLRGRIAKMRDQLPLHPVPFDVPIEPLPFTGCVTRQNLADLPHESDAAGRDGQNSSVAPTADVQNGNDNGHASPGGHKNGRHDPRTPPAKNSQPNVSERKGEGVGNGHLQINDFQKPKPNARSVHLPQTQQEMGSGSEVQPCQQNGNGS